MECHFYTWLLIRLYGNDTHKFYDEYLDTLTDQDLEIPSKQRFFAINAAIRCDLAVLHASLRLNFSEMVKPGAQVEVDETMLAYQGYPYISTETSQF